jgi:hypothetical protein
MKLNEQRNTLRGQSKETEERLEQFIHWLRTSNKFKGGDDQNVVYGNDWIRVGEVWPFLQELQRDLREIRNETLTAEEYNEENGY